MNFSRAFPAGQDFRMRHARQYTGTKNDQTPWMPIFLQAVHACRSMGTYVDPPAHFIKGLRPSIRSIEDRKITAGRHETTDTDPGIATTKDDYSLETYILSTNHYQIELLTNLDQVPESGAIVVVSFPKPKGGSGFPARVFAIVP